jgi:hypothetical protein
MKQTWQLVSIVIGLLVVLYWCGWFLWFVYREIRNTLRDDRTSHELREINRRKHEEELQRLKQRAGQGFTGGTGKGTPGQLKEDSKWDETHRD